MIYCYQQILTNDRLINFTQHTLHGMKTFNVSKICLNLFCLEMCTANQLITHTCRAALPCPKYNSLKPMITGLLGPCFLGPNFVRQNTLMTP